MTLQVYSTLTRKKEPFPKVPGEAVSMYVCGPTVYKPSHIGHMVGPVIFDTVKRYLTHLGYKVTWVVNITDVDDKLIARAKELGTTVHLLAETMTADYYECLKKLNVTGIDHFPKATEHISGMVAMIEALIAKGHAYPAGGDVYFDVTHDADYGKLCNRTVEDVEPATGAKKRNPGDFALWKAAKPEEPPEVQFASPWGKGRPGWHIECSAMSLALLGETLDIHGGGLDLTFPHHENELAQSECCNGVPLAKIWMHNGLLKLKNKDGKEDKMAGSLGNVLNVADALKHVPGGALRFFMLQTHYRSPIDLGIWDWNDKTKPIPDGLISAKAAFETFLRFAERVDRVLGTSFADRPGFIASGSTNAKFAAALKKFEQFMDDDFNTGGAVGLLFELVTNLNKFADDLQLEVPGRATAQGQQEFADGVGLIRDITGILGLELATPKAELAGGDEFVAGLMQLILDLRANLRADAKVAAKDNPLKKAMFDQTDLIRSRLAALNVTLEDRPAGTTWRVG